jgi:hypothetical protein
MRQLIQPKNQKFIIVLSAALVSFLGLEAAGMALGYNQVRPFLRISLYVYLFLVFLETFIFDLHLKRIGSWQTFEHSFWKALKERFSYLSVKHHWLHFQNYLLLPGIIFWTTACLLFLNQFDELRKQTWIFLSTLALSLSFWYLKTVFYNHKNASRLAREFIFLAKLYASFLSFTVSLGIARYFGYGGIWAGLAVFLLTYLLLYQAFFQHHFVGFSTVKFLLGSAVFLGAGAFLIYSFWNVNFYSGALILTAFYNTIWGIVHHQFIDKNLTRTMVYEYLAVLFVILVIVLGTTNFAQKI